jgi:hypothetical protein
MREFFRHPGMVLVYMIIGLGILTVTFFKTCTHEVTCTGVVISHNTTSDRSGHIRYYTIVKFDDCVKSISGLDYYIVEIGGTIHYTKTELNK